MGEDSGDGRLRSNKRRGSGDAGKTASLPRRSRIIRSLSSWILLAALAVKPASAQHLTIRFFNVGQGDAALITSPEGKTVLIDGGKYNGDVSYYLTLLHVDTLDLIVGSHNHADHIGGLWDIVRTSTVYNYMDNGVPGTTSTYETLAIMLKAHHVQYLAATPRTLGFGSATLRILPMPPGDESQNNSSVGVLLTYKTFTALFTGDAEGKERDEWEAHGGLPHVSVLKVAHHGAANGTDSTWLATTRPRVAVISVGRNSYGHPSKQTLSGLAEIGATVYRTDRVGDITVDVDSLGGFTVTTDSSDAARALPASYKPHR